jgi:hypothetical protein
MDGVFEKRARQREVALEEDAGYDWSTSFWTLQQFTTANFLGKMTKTWYALRLQTKQLRTIREVIGSKDEIDEIAKHLRFPPRLLSPVVYPPDPPTEEEKRDIQRFENLFSIWQGLAEDPVLHDPATFRGHVRGFWATPEETAELQTHLKILFAKKEGYPPEFIDWLSNQRNRS